MSDGRKIAGMTPVRGTRRVLLKATAKILVGWVALAIILSARIAAAASGDVVCQAWLGAAVVGQAAPADAPSADKTQQTADLLKRARQAMDENNFSAAEALISQAEALGVQYSIFYMGDTPKKARHDLERKRGAAPAAAPTKPSQMFDPLGLNRKKDVPTSDPFAGRSTEPPAASAGPAGAAAPVGPLDTKQSVVPLPKTDGANAAYGPPAVGSPAVPPPMAPPYRIVEPGENDVRVPGATGRTAVGGMAAANPPSPTAHDNPLRAARLALAFGDVRRANALIEQARRMHLNYQPLDDTPDKVEAAVRHYEELSTLEKESEVYRQKCSRNLMEQADALLRWNERDAAEKLAIRAASMQVVYGPFELKPQDLLARIAVTRSQGEGQPMAPPPVGPQNAGAPPAPVTSLVARQQAVELVRQARQAMAGGQLDRAEWLARQAEQLHVPESAFAPGEDRPGLVLIDLRQSRLRQSPGVVPAAGQNVLPMGGIAGPDHGTVRATYDPGNDPTRNMMASGQQPAYPTDPRLAQSNNPPPALGGTEKVSAMALFEQGEAALKAHDAPRAYELFRQAATRMNELDPDTARRLQDHLQLLSVPSRTRALPGAVPPPLPGQPSSLAADTAARQQVLAKQVFGDLAHKEANARAMRESDPKGSLALLEEARKNVEAAGLDNANRDQLLRRVDRAIAETRQFIEQNRPQIELAEKNRRIQQDVERQQRAKVEVQEKLALKIDEFNRLMDERRYEEAQVAANQAAELDPKNPVVVQIQWQAKFVRRFMNYKAIQDEKENGVVEVLDEVDRAGIPFAGDKNPLVFPDAKVWSKLSASRQKLAAGQKRQRSEREIDIEKKLRTPVSLQFTNAPLSKVLDHLAKLAEINIVSDPQGLTEEGQTTDTPVTIELHSEIMLKSALNLILEPLHLSYVVKNEVLTITSEQMRDGQVYMQTYNVADLVIPIPNFVPTAMGLQAAYSGAMANVNPWYGGGGAPMGSATTAPLSSVVASRDGKGSGAMLNPNMLAQVSTGSHAGLVPGPKGQPAGPGPGGLGGGAQADFDSLIDLIKSTVKPTTWDDVGGPGSIAPFETNLSLVVSQTQEVHEEIADLLEQLRRLQDLQVTVECRFITLSDNFFERIGVSFDFDVNSNILGKGLDFLASQGGLNNNQGPNDYNSGSRAAVVGMQTPTTFSADMDVPFTQNSYGLAVPQFGGFDATAGASLGFAIMSDIEAYFFINAAQGDKRTNVLQAPKVTLFNGQQATVTDQTQSPFVISVIPVVGDFAAAQQPVIVVLSEGTFMTIQAVVSNDKRFVRLTVVPFFSTISAVNTFQFTGSTSTTTDTTRSGIQPNATDPTKLWNQTGDNTTSTNSGTTVQLPSFSFVTVTTTVSVPDGGTILLGGIKRLSEGRTEAGVPMLDKIPYLNRLFKNTAIGREAQSLMMMVTPRIIIQEEEEEKLGVQPQQP
jgi:general secretion pathway protein D